MQVILTQNVPNLGKKDQVIDVKPGYGRNFLVPQGLAAYATPNALEQLTSKQEARTARKDQLVSQAKELAQKIKNLNVEFLRKTTAKKTLYGSITEKDLAKAVTAEIKVTIDPDQIDLEEHIKKLGDFSATVHLTEDTDAKLHFSVKVEK